MSVLRVADARRGRLPLKAVHVCEKVAARFRRQKRCLGTPGAAVGSARGGTALRRGLIGQSVSLIPW